MQIEALSESGFTKRFPIIFKSRQTFDFNEKSCDEGNLIKSNKRLFIFFCSQKGN